MESKKLYHQAPVNLKDLLLKHYWYMEKFNQHENLNHWAYKPDEPWNTIASDTRFPPPSLL